MSCKNTLDWEGPLCHLSWNSGNMKQGHKVRTCNQTYPELLALPTKNSGILRSFNPEENAIVILLTNCYFFIYILFSFILMSTPMQVRYDYIITLWNLLSCAKPLYNCCEPERSPLNVHTKHRGSHHATHHTPTDCSFAKEQWEYQKCASCWLLT